MVRLVRWGGMTLAVLFALCALGGASLARATATFTVTNADDAGTGSLRAAITAANAAGGGTINFSIGSGVQTISITSGVLPTIAKPITIDGTTQPGYAGSPLIDLDWGGSAAFDGLVVTAGASTIRGLAITDFECGISLVGAAKNTVSGDWIGVAADGSSPAYPDDPGNWDGICVLSKVPTQDKTVVPSIHPGVRVQRSDLVTGGEGPGPRSGRVVSCVRASSLTAGNDRGRLRSALRPNCAESAVREPAEASLQPGAPVSAPSSSGAAATVSTSSVNTIGGTGDGSGNVISGNGIGIYAGKATPASTIDGNYIGVLADGTTPDGNSCSGIYFEGTTAGSLIGGTSVAARNVIGGNGCSAVSLYGASNVTIEGNWLGFDATGGPLGNTYRGVDVWNGGSNNVIGGTAPGAGNVIGGSGWDGIGFSGAARNNKVLGNLIGTDPTGTTANADQQYAVQIWGKASGNVIGGTTTAARNVLSANVFGGVGIFDKGTMKNVVEGDYIGSDVAGMTALGNNTGVQISAGATTNTVGGTTAGAGNVISGNSGSGVAIGNSGTNSNVVQGNLIGLAADGSTPLANGSLSPSSCSGGAGVQIYDGAASNVIGGTTSAARNVISSNGCIGVWLVDAVTKNVVEGNYVGTDVAGTTSVPNWTGVSLEGEGFTGPGPTSNVVGGTAKGAGNVISGNLFTGLTIEWGGTNKNAVQGNVIGLGVDGAALPNQDGIEIGIGAASNTVGGSTAAARNVISGNAHNGVNLFSTGTSHNVVAGNFIGVAPDGQTGVGNGWSGVVLYEGATSNVVGGSKAAANVIASNTNEGVAIENGGTNANVVSANLIGVGADGHTALMNGYDGVGLWYSPGDTAGPHGNVIGGTGAGAGNTIFFSGHASGDGIWADGALTTDNQFVGNILSEAAAAGLGIDLTNGANAAIAAPAVRLVASKSGTVVSGTAAGAGYRIEVYTSSSCTVGHEQGQKLLGVVTSSKSSTWTLGTRKLSAGTAVTAAQTDKNGDTSDLSTCAVVPS